MEESTIIYKPPCNKRSLALVSWRANSLPEAGAGRRGELGSEAGCLSCHPCAGPACDLSCRSSRQSDIKEKTLLIGGWLSTHTHEVKKGLFFACVTLLLMMLILIAMLKLKLNVLTGCKWKK